MNSVIKKPVLPGIISQKSITTHGYEVIDHGAFMTFDYNSSVDIVEELYDGSTITITFTFEDDGTDNYSLNVDAIGGENIRIIYKCKNFKNELGTGTTEPIEFGKIGDKKLLINFWIYKRGKEKLRKIEYTIYKEQ